MCKEVKLSNDDLENMTIGMCLDYIDEYVEQKDPNKKSEKVRQATQDDFDNF